jgi:hypothetical protein
MTNSTINEAPSEMPQSDAVWPRDLVEGTIYITAQNKLAYAATNTVVWLADDPYTDFLRFFEDDDPDAEIILFEVLADRSRVQNIKLGSEMGNKGIRDRFPFKHAPDGTKIGAGRFGPDEAWLVNTLGYIP